MSAHLPADYPALLADIKQRVRRAQTRAMMAVNAELIRLYWGIGALIERRQKQEGWGAAVIPRLAQDLHNELPEEKGFSERNIKRMLAFYREYPHLAAARQYRKCRDRATGCGTTRIGEKRATGCGTKPPSAGTANRRRVISILARPSAVATVGAPR